MSTSAFNCVVGVGGRIVNTGCQPVKSGDMLGKIRAGYPADSATRLSEIKIHWAPPAAGGAQ